jgi:hypothetical protein
VGPTENELQWEYRHGHWMVSDRLRKESSHDYIWKDHRGILKKFAGYKLHGNYSKTFFNVTILKPLAFTTSSIAMTHTLNFV